MRNKEHPKRYKEKLGFYNNIQHKKTAFTIHIHGASVGETLSSLPLIDSLLVTTPDIEIVVTSVTKTSAAILEKKLPPNVRHIFAPLDTPDIVTHFFDFTQPDIILILDSEIWPNFLLQAKKRQVPVFGINMRFSPRSQKRWLLCKKDFKEIMSSYEGFFVQNDETARFIRQISDKTLRICSNLKWAQKPVTLQKDFLQGEKERFCVNKKIIVFLSTHFNEELSLSKAIYTIENAQIIIVPRHPNRAESIKSALQAYGIPSILRSNNATLQNDQIYIADTLGEIPLWATIADIVVMGKTFDKIGGGHNIIEPALYNNAIICGPKMYNFKEVVDIFQSNDASINVETISECAKHIRQLVSSPMMINTYANKAISTCKMHHEKALAFLHDLKKYLPPSNNITGVF